MSLMTSLPSLEREHVQSFDVHVLSDRSLTATVSFTRHALDELELELGWDKA